MIDPLVRVTRGEPDDVELAALVAALVAVAAAPNEPGEVEAPSWNDPATVLKLPTRPGPRAWRSAA